MRLSILALVGVVALSMPPAAAQQRATPEPAGPHRLLEDVRYLSDDALAGRLTGSPGADSAAAYIARRFREVGLQPAAGGWFQNFEVSRSAPGAQHAGIAGGTGRNVVGILPGRDPELRKESVIIGAHYDHLGHGEFGALDPDSTGRVHNGADDNASGVAALIQIARRLQVAPPARTVVFIAFSGEELGLLGSAHYVRNAMYPLSRSIAMINLDMVGRLRNGRLIVYGVGTAKEFPALLDSLNWYAGFDLKAQGDGYGPSDQSSFYAAKLPVLHLFTDLHEDYHRATDDWEKINVDGLKRVADFAAGLVTALGNRPRPLTFVEQTPTMAHGGVSATSGTGGYGAYLGTVPDMTDNPGGVRLTGVRAGSPAEQAGLRAGDIITKVGSMNVPDLQAMTDALRAHKPGDTVEIVIRRGSETAVVKATLGTRGG